MHSDSDESVDARASGDIDLMEIGRAISLKRRFVVVPTLLALVGSLIYVNVVKPRYSAEARVLLENQESYLTRSDKGERAEQAAPDAEAVGSQIQLLTSRDLARRAIGNLSLHGNDEFDPLANGIGPLTRILVLFGLTRDPTRLAPEERILSAYFDRLAVLSPTKTRVLSIEFTSRDPDLAARAANSIAESYIEMQQEAKREQAHVAAQSLGKLVAELQTRVAEAEARAEDFRAKMGLLVGSNNTIVASQQLGDLNAQLSISRVAQADAEAKAKLLREMLRQNRVGEIPDVANNELIRRISEQRVAVAAQLALESRTLLHAHPRIKELRAQLARLDSEWRAAAERTARTLENEARIAGSRVENLTRTLEDQKKIVGAAGADEVRLRELERIARLLKEELEADTAKYQEALARESVKASPADARIIQRALAPQIPAFPKKFPIAAFATIAAFVLSCGGIIAGELLSGRAAVKRNTQLRRPAWRPVTASHASPLIAPKANSALSSGEISGTEEQRPHGEVADAASHEIAADQNDPPSTGSQTDASLGADLRIGAGAKGVREIDAAPGKTGRVRSVRILVLGSEKLRVPTGVELARALSRRGLTILAAANVTDVAYDDLVVTEGQKPHGLADLTAGAASFGQVIYRDVGSSRLHVMPAGSMGGPTEYEASSVVDALAQTYEFVVFATASIERAEELAPLFEVILVQGAEGEAEALRSQLLSTGARNVSILEEPDESESPLAAA